MKDNEGAWVEVSPEAPNLESHYSLSIKASKYYQQQNDHHMNF